MEILWNIYHLERRYTTYGQLHRLILNLNSNASYWVAWKLNLHQYLEDATTLSVRKCSTIWRLDRKALSTATKMNKIGVAAAEAYTGSPCRDHDV
jgi:hypothetical protein